MGDAGIHNLNPDVQTDPGINFFGLTNYRNQNRKFGIKIDDRRRHMYLVGKTGMGKTTILENMVLNDIYAGHGVGLVDPHGDFAEKVIDYIPPHRVNDIVYFNPSDMDYPIGFNILESINPEYRHLVASGLMGVFKKIWPDVWSARMEYILNNTILALLDFPGTTLLGINRLLADDAYRKKVIATLKDPVVKAFWESEFEKYDERFRREAIAPIQNKIGQFLSASIIRNIVAQVKSRINIREIMDTKKIFIMNLSKGRIGEDNSRLLGGMLITKIQLSAMERVDILEPDRKDFFLYVDEFQNFATESFANILSEARKYRLDLIMAHQYMEQLDEKVLAAVIGNVGTMVTFRVGSSDAEILAKEFIPTFIEEDLVNLPKYHIYLKLMIDGVASRPFSALTLPPIGSPTGSREKVVRVSRERYAVPRDKIEDKIARWSGMEVDGEMEEEDVIGSIESPLTNEVKSRAPSNQPVLNPILAESKNSAKLKTEVKNITPVIPKSTPSSDRQITQSQNKNFIPKITSSSSNNKLFPKKNKKRDESFNSINSEKVFLVDPLQKGISLNQVLRSTPPPQSPKQQSIKNNFSSGKENFSKTIQPSSRVEATRINKPEKSLSVQKNIQDLSPQKHINNSNLVVKTVFTKENKINTTLQTEKQTSAQQTISLTQLKSNNSSKETPKPTVFPSPTPQQNSTVQKEIKETKEQTIPEPLAAPSNPKVIKPGEIIKFD